MSVSLSAERDRLQRQVEALERSLSVTHSELELLTSDTDEESDHDVTKEKTEQSTAGLLALREKVQKEIQNLETVLGTEDGFIYVSDNDDDDDDDDSNSGESELSLSADSCLQMNLVYQQVVQETLDQLETLLAQNHRQQKELMSQLSGPIREPSKESPASSSSSYQQPISLYLGRFLKPYFKDKMTGLGPPANQETKEKSSRMTGCLDDKKLKVKRWESWQKTLLIHSVTRDSLRRMIQPKLSRVDYLTQKLSSAQETDRQQIREQITSLEKEIDQLQAKKEEELVGDRYEDHDWQKISNIDFEGTKDADDIRLFWQNFLHPSINKTRWSQEEVQQLKQISRQHDEKHWKTIAEELGTGRTAFMCLQTFQRFVSDSLRRRSWTPAEDALLKELVDRMRIGNFIPYTQMSYFMEGRDPAQLIYRWNQVLDPSLKKGPWTKQEDQLLLEAVSRYGERNWWKIRLEVPGRTDSACRDRYHDCLKAGIKRGAFDKQERELLISLLEKHGVGRWAKIAAEIPHRNDAHCLREWRKLSRSQPTPSQKENKARKAPRRKGEKAKKVSSAGKRIKRQLIKLEEEEESTEEEDEEMVVEYMDSDEEQDEKKEKLAVKSIEEVEERADTLPPLDDWIPAEKAEPFTFLSFRPVVLPSTGDATSGKAVRSTIVGKSGCSVIIGPSPRVLQWEERHNSNAMMMVSPDQLRAYLHRKAQKFNNQGRVTGLGMGYELQAAVTPWIGNLLIPAKPRLTMADFLREQGERSQLSSTPVFLLFLQTMNVDTVGCKEIIERRRNKVVYLTPPQNPSSVRKRNPRTVAGRLQQMGEMRETQQDLQHNPNPKQQHQVQPQQPSLIEQAHLPSQTVPQEAVIQRPIVQLQQPKSKAEARSVRLQSPNPPLQHIVPLPTQQPVAAQSVPQTVHLVGPQRPAATGIISSVSVESPTTSHQKMDWEGGGASLSLAPPPCLQDHDYLFVSPYPKLHGSDTHLLTPPPIQKSSCPSKYNLRQRKRGGVDDPEKIKCDAHQSVSRMDAGGDGADGGVIQNGKRIRKLSQKAKALQRSGNAQAETKGGEIASSSYKKRHRESHLRQGIQVPTQQVPQLPGLCLRPGQSMWLMTSNGLVQLATAPSKGLQLPLVASAHLPPSVGYISTMPPVQLASSGCQVVAPKPPVAICPSKPLPQACIQQPVPYIVPSSISSCPPQPPSKVSQPEKSSTGMDPPCSRDTLQFDPSLMFLEPQVEVCNWLSGHGGVVVPGAGVALPHLPPFVGSLNTLCALLRAKKSLTKSSLQLLSQGSKPRHPQAKPRPDNNTEKTFSEPRPDLPDSTSDLRNNWNQPASFISSDLSLDEETELVSSVRQLVAERFSGNPAYQLLKARFLSCFTVPGLMATIQPVTEKTLAPQGSQQEEEEKEEDEEVVELKKIKERGRWRSERSLLLCDGPGASANHFSGISPPVSEQTIPVRTQPPVQ